MKKKLEHIGIAVKDVDSAIDVFRRLLKRQSLPIQNYQKDGLNYKIGFISFGGVELELIEPLNRKGMAQEHLDKFGPGVFHLALQVPDLDEAIEECSARGFEIQNVRTGAAGGRVVFLKDPILPGIYLELVEPKRS